MNTVPLSNQSGGHLGSSLRNASEAGVASLFSVTGTSVIVREATADDLDAILDLLEIVAAEDRYIATEAPLNRDELATSFRSKYFADSRQTAIFVAEQERRVVGRIGIEGTEVSSLGMMVAPDWRGRGIGQRLLQRAIDWARSVGAHKVSLDVFPDNEAAIRLYRSFGFEQEGLLRGHYRRRDGRLRDAVLMGLLLTGRGERGRSRHH